SGGRTVFPVRGTDTENTKADKGALAADFRYDEGFRIREEGISPCLTASLSGMGGSNNGFSNNIYAVLTPDRIEKRQNGRRFKEDGEPMFTLTAQDRHGIAIRESIGINKGIVINPLKGKTSNGWHFEQQVYDPKGISRAVKAGGGSGNIPKTFEGLRIRKLTPLECFRLQGFTDEQFYKAKNDGVSNSQLYKQAGNSVSVPVIKAIAERL